jgi:hypothetical protein
MEMGDIKKIAKQHGITVGQMKKADIIRAIQKAEINETCYASGKAGICGQDGCLWRDDCR